MEQNYQLNQTDIDNLSSASKWSMVMTVMCGISSFSMIILGLMFPLMDGMMGMAELEDELPFSLSLFGLLYLVLGLLYAPITYYLFMFYDRMQKVVKRNRTEMLSDTIVYLKRYFKFMGLMIIGLIILYMLIIIGVFVFAMASI